MNHLAHLALVDPTPAYLAGGLLADFCKGRLAGHSDQDEGFPQGVALHRGIDRYTDQHPLVREATARCQWPRVGPILMDLAMDYYLIKHWSRFYPGTPESLAQRSLQASSAYAAKLSPQAVEFVDRMQQFNGLLRPSSMTGLARSIDATATRLSRPSLLLGGISEVERLGEPWERTFLLFYPELMAEVSGRIESTAE